jgi:hypothetical protein
LPKICALSGEAITLPKNRTDFVGGGYTASLDRIDSSKGYIVGNVQWVHKDINFMKFTFSESRFIDLCKKVVNYQEKHNG